jgi:hypothetical protein
MGRVDRRDERRALALGRIRESAGGLVLTQHAKERAAELGFHETEVLSCIAKPETVFPGGPKHPSGRLIYRRGRCACVVHLASRRVLTVLLNVPREWTHGTDTLQSIEKMRAGAKIAG